MCTVPFPSQVSKTPESGEFITRGSFIVRGERTYYRNVPLAVGIGLMLEPHAAVIGGPPSAIKGKTKAYTELRPGQFEPNDVAKKVLRILKQNVSEDEEKALKGYPEYHAGCSIRTARWFRYCRTP